MPRDNWDESDYEEWRSRATDDEEHSYDDEAPPAHPCPVSDSFINNEYRENCNCYDCQAYTQWLGAQGMPTEICRMCRYEFRELPLSERRALQAQNRNAGGRHHGRSCKFSLCTGHCTCTDEQQREWRTIQPTVLRRCGSCGNRSAHICVTYTEMGIPFSQSFNCSSCCQKQQCRSLIPCNQRSHELRQCGSCVIRRPLDAFPRDGRQVNNVCIYCLPNCAMCGMYAYHAAGENGEDAFCDDCGGCTPNVVRQLRESEYAQQVTQDAYFHNRRCCRCVLIRPKLFASTIHFRFAYPDNEDVQKSKHAPVLRAIGCELEIAGFKNPTKEALANVYNTCVKWNAAIGTDGSIGTDAGIEIRTSPASGLHFAQQIWEITRALKQAGAFVSEKCGFHTHVDVRDALFVKVRDSAYPLGYRSASNPSSGKLLSYLIRGWLFAEDAWYAMVYEDSVRMDEYCMRVRDRIRRLEHDQATTININEVTYSGLYRSLSRYSGLNIQAIARHKTVEFRLHHGTLVRRIVTAWGQMCAKFVDSILTSEEPEGVVELIKADPEKFLIQIAPTPDARKYVTWRKEWTAAQKRAA